MSQINPKWAEKILQCIVARSTIDEISSYKPATQWLIYQLTKRNLPYKIHNLGAGVQRITTDTDTCPCCKRSL